MTVAAHFGESTAIAAPEIPDARRNTSGVQRHLRDEERRASAGDLIALGPTVAIALERGAYTAAIGREGVMLVGTDFDLGYGRGYVVNMLEPTTLVMRGPGFGSWWPSPSAAPVTTSGETWAFAVGGPVAKHELLPPGCGVRVVNERTAATLGPMPVSGGSFSGAFVDAGRSAVIHVGDELAVDIVTRDAGRLLDRSVRRRVAAEDLRHGFLLLSFDGRPGAARLLPNYPNPFNPETWLPFALHADSNVTVRIYTVSGHLTRAIEIGKRGAGYHTARSEAVYWDGRDGHGELAASGVYVCELEAGATRHQRRIVLRK